MAEKQTNNVLDSRNKVLVGNIEEGFREVDRTTYSPTGAKGGLPVEVSPFTAQHPSQSQVYRPALDLFGQPDVQIGRIVDQYLKDPHEATLRFADEETRRKAIINKKNKDNERKRAEELLKISPNKDYDILVPEHDKRNYAVDEKTGKIKIKINKRKMEGLNIYESFNEPVFNRVYFRHYLGSAGVKPESKDPLIGSSPEMGEIVVLPNVTETEARQAAATYTDAIKSLGTSHPIWSRGKWMQRIPGYTEEGFASLSNTAGEEASGLERIYGSIVPVPLVGPFVSSLIKGVTTELTSIVSPEGTVGGMTWLMNKEKEFMRWFWDDPEHHSNPDVKYRWTRELNARQVKYLLEKPDAEGLHLYADFLGENVGLTYGALKIFKIVPKSKTMFKDVKTRVFKVYEKEAIAQLKKKRKPITQENIEKQLEYIEARRFVQDAHILMKQDVADQFKTAGKRYKKLRLFLKNAAFGIGQNRKKFIRDTGFQELGFAGGQSFGAYLESGDAPNEMARLAYGFGFAFFTPATANKLVRTAVWGGLKSTQVLRDTFHFMGMPVEGFQKVYNAIEGTGDIAALQSMMVKGEITKAEYESAYKFFSGLSEMDPVFIGNAMKSLRKTQKIKGKFTSWIQEMASIDLRGNPLKANQGIQDSKLAQAGGFEFDPTKSAEENIKNITKRFNLALGQSLQIKLLTLAEAKLAEQADIGITLDYNFLSHAKILEDKHAAATSLNKMLDLVDANFSKAGADPDFLAFLTDARTSVHSAFGEVAENVKILKNVVETMALQQLVKKADDPFYAAKNATMDNIIDAYGHLLIVELESGVQRPAKEIAQKIVQIRKDVAASKLDYRQKDVIKQMKLMRRTDANPILASETSAINYVESWRELKNMANRRYDAALEGVDIFSDDAFDFLMNLRKVTTTTDTGKFAGRNSSEVTQVIDNLTTPAIERKLAEVYESFVGKDIAGDILDNVEEVREVFLEQLKLRPDATVMDEFFEIRKNMDDLVSTFGIETIDMKLPLRMDDLDNIEKGLNSIIGTLDGDKLRLTGTSAERQQLDQFMKVHTYMTNELNRTEGLLKINHPDKWVLYNKASDFYRHNISEPLYENNLTSWLLDTKREVPVSKQNPTGFIHKNSIRGEGTDEGWLDFVWKRLWSKPDETELHLRQMLGIREGDQWFFVTDDMIRQAEMDPSGLYAGYTEGELRYIKTKHTAFQTELQDYYVGKFNKAFLDAGEQAGIDTTGLVKRGEIDFHAAADRLEEITKGGKTTVAGIATQAHKTLFYQASSIEGNVSKEIFNTQEALDLRKKLMNANFNDAVILRKVTEADNLLKRSKTNLTKLAVVEEHQDILKGAIRDMLGKEQSIESMFKFLVVDPEASTRIDDLKQFLVHGEVTAPMRTLMGKTSAYGADIMKGKPFKFLSPKKMTAKQFDEAMGRIIAVGLRRATTVTMEPRLNIGIGKIGAPEGSKRAWVKRRFEKDIQIEYGVDHAALIEMIERYDSIISPYIDAGAMRVISQMGILMDPTVIRGTIGQMSSPLKGVAKFTPASWISRFYAANSGRTSYRYIGAEALVASLLRNRAAVTLALLENKQAQKALAEMLIRGKPKEMISHQAMAWLPDVAARAAQIAEYGLGSIVYDIGDVIIPKVYDIPTTDDQMYDLELGA